ncbi:MAG: hypothetical protein ACM3TT_00150 [Syntrophothermus sp.]
MREKMKKRRGLTALLMMLAVCLAVVAGQVTPATAGVSVTITSTNPQPEELLFMGAMAAFFGVEQAQIQSAGRPALEMMPAFYFAGESRMQPLEVIRVHSKGERWGRMAKVYGLAPNWHGKYISKKHKKLDYYELDDEEIERLTYVRFIHEYYLIPEDTIIIWLGRGLSINEIFIAVNLATRVSVAPATIIDLRLRRVPWEVIGVRYGVPYSQLWVPVKPRTTYGRVIVWDDEKEKDDHKKDKKKHDDDDD